MNDNVINKIYEIFIFFRRFYIEDFSEGHFQYIVGSE